MKKLTIGGYEKLGEGTAKKTFTTSINPSQISISKSITYKQEGEGGTGSGSGSGAGDGNSGSNAGSQPKQNSYGATELSLELYFDGTGVISDDDKEVHQWITDLEDVVYNYQGNIHGPYFLLISWGQLNFLCGLKSMKTDYTLFDPEGMPLRAKVSMSFVSLEKQEIIDKGAKRSSPDMSHLKTVRVGDRLPLMAYEIYDSLDHYIQVARLNGLTNFRDLEVGSTLVFPPLKK